VLEHDGDRYAITESPLGVEVDPESLETRGRTGLTAGLDADATLGHVYVDDGVQWGLGATFGSECSYTRFCRPEGADPDLPHDDFVRFRLPPDGGRAERQRLRRGPVEFPTIHYSRYNGRKYRYAHLAATGFGSLPTAITTVDLEGPTANGWSDPGLHPGEPLFVPAPSPATEDDGVLLSLALDGDAERSVLLCLDAASLTERARPPAPPAAIRVPRAVLRRTGPRAVDGVSRSASPGTTERGPGR
jgi:hypothetical protein